MVNNNFIITKISELDLCKKGDISDKDLLDILNQIETETERNHLNNSCEKAMDLYINIFRLLENQSYISKFIETIANSYGYHNYSSCLMDCLAEIKYKFNKKDFNILFKKKYFMNNKLDTLCELCKNNPNHNIDLSKLNINFDNYFINEKFQKLKKIYESYKFDLNIFNLKINVSYYPEERKIWMKYYIEMCNNLIMFLKDYQLKFDSKFLIDFIGINSNLFFSKMFNFNNELILLGKYYNNDKLTKDNILDLLKIVSCNKKYIYDMNYETNDETNNETNNKCIWKFLIEDLKVTHEKFNTHEMNNEILYEHIVEYCTTPNLNYFKTFEEFIKYFFETDTVIDINFIDKLKTMCNKFAITKNYFTEILKKCNPELLNQDFLKSIFKENADIKPFLENKCIVPEDLILECNNENLEEILIECTNYNQYFTENIIDHLIFNFFSSDIKATQTKVYKQKVYKPQPPIKYNYNSKTYNQDFYERIQKVTIYINDTAGFEKYKNKIVEKIELYKNIYNMNTCEMIEYINNNDVTQYDMLIACLDDKIKDVQMSMQQYFEKINKLSNKECGKLSNKDSDKLSNKECGKLSNKVIIKKIIKKVVKKNIATSDN